MTPSPRPRFVFVAALLLPCACQSAPPQPNPYGPREVVELERWEVHGEGRLLGHLVKLRIEDPVYPQEFFRVENDYGQWVGHVSEAGRFSRRVPFREAEKDLGIYPMTEGLALLFEVDGPVRLQGQSALEAAGTRRREK